MELLSFVFPSEQASKPAVLHLLLPLPPDEGVLEQRGTGGDLDLADGLERLTGREREVLSLLASGLNTSAIASSLFISDFTARNHVQHILKKLDVHARLEAIALLRGDLHR